MPLLAALAWSAGIAALDSQIALRGPLLTLAMRGPDGRDAALAAGVDAAHRVSALGNEGVTVGVAIAVALALGVAARRRPIVGAAVRALVALGLAAGVWAFDASARSASLSDAMRVLAPPWADIPGFVPVVLARSSSQDARDVDALVSRDAVHLRGGVRVRLAQLASPGGARTLRDELRRAASRPEPPPCCAEPPPLPSEERETNAVCIPASHRAVTIALDARTTGRTLRAIVSIADEAGAGALRLMGRATRTVHPSFAPTPGSRLFVAVSTPSPVSRNLYLASAAASCLASDRIGWRAVVGSAPTVRVAARAGATEAPFELALGRPGDRDALDEPSFDPSREAQALAARSVVYLFVADDATVDAVCAAADRLDVRARHVVLMTDASPSATLTGPLAPTGD